MFNNIIFAQKRIGKNGRIFLLYKFRTMYFGAQKDKEKYRHLNEADGPVFKIKDDPRFTTVGKILARIGLDELPQIVNILKGDMVLVGPRPLPIEEEAMIPKKWRTKRRAVKPGLLSSWVVEGAHNLSFTQWMELDMRDIKNKSFVYDFWIVAKTVLLFFKVVF